MRIGSTRLGVVALAGLLVLAGCGALGSGGGTGGGGDVEATLTPVEVPDGSTAPGRAVGELPSGVAPDGVEDAFALARAHTEELQGRSYTVRSVVTLRYANGTLRGHRRTVARVGADRSRFHVSHVTDGPRPPLRPVGKGSVRAPAARRSGLTGDAFSGRSPDRTAPSTGRAHPASTTPESRGCGSAGRDPPTPAARTSTSRSTPSGRASRTNRMGTGATVSSASSRQAG